MLAGVCSPRESHVKVWAGVCCELLWHGAGLWHSCRSSSWWSWAGCVILRE